MEKALRYSEFLLEREIRKELIKILHDGVEMKMIYLVNEGMVEKGEEELNRLISNSAKRGETPIVKEFVPEIQALVKKFAESGQSGGSAPFTTSVIVQVIEKLLKQEPLGGIECTDDEWEDVSDISDVEPEGFFQNKRLSSVFKEGKEGKPYYLDAIVFRNPKKSYTFTSGSVDLPGLANDKVGKIGSSQYIKSLPFEPKTFVIDVDETEYRKMEDGSLTPEEGGGWWESRVKYPNQLEEVWEYYDRMDKKINYE